MSITKSEILTASQNIDKWLDKIPADEIPEEVIDAANALRHVLDEPSVLEKINSLHFEKRGENANGPYVICDYDKTTWPCLTHTLMGEQLTLNRQKLANEIDDLLDGDAGEGVGEYLADKITSLFGLSLREVSPNYQYQDIFLEEEDEGLWVTVGDNYPHWLSRSTIQAILNKENN